MAASVTLQSLRLRVIVFSGPPCSGKSTLAERVSRVLGLVHLQMDAVRTRILPGSVQSQADRETAYRAMHLAAELLLGQGRSVILDATYNAQHFRSEVGEIARARSASLFVIECAVTAEEAVRRFEARSRGHPAVDLTRERVARQAFEYRYCNRGLSIDTERLSIDESVVRVLEYVCCASGMAVNSWLCG